MTTIKCRKCVKVYPFNEKICPECGKITIYEIIEERIVQYATQRNVKNIDYAECENEEASASQLIL